MKKILSIIALSLAIFAFMLVPVQTASAAFFSPDWDTIQADATQIGLDAQTLQTQAARMRQEAEAIQAVETDPAVLAATTQIIDLASQIEADAAAIAVTADDINTRIDNSEGTTLELAADIGEMADRIGEMADRILWTEGQIGIMADRIVTSEHLISDSSLTLAQDIQQISLEGSTLSRNILDLVSDLLGSL